MHLVHWLAQVMSDQEVYIHPVCELVFREHAGHTLVCSAVATSIHGSPLLLAKGVGGLLSVHGGLALMFHHGCQMLLRYWISRGSVDMGVC